MRWKLLAVRTLPLVFFLSDVLNTSENAPSYLEVNRMRKAKNWLYLCMIVMFLLTFLSTTGLFLGQQ